LTIWSQLNEEIYQGIYGTYLNVRRTGYLRSVQAGNKYSSTSSSLCGSNFLAHTGDGFNRPLLTIQINVSRERSIRIGCKVQFHIMHCYSRRNGKGRSLIARVSEFKGIKEIFGSRQKTSFSHSRLSSNHSA